MQIKVAIKMMFGDIVCVHCYWLKADNNNYITDYYYFFFYFLLNKII